MSKKCMKEHACFGKCVGNLHDAFFKLHASV